MNESIYSYIVFNIGIVILIGMTFKSPLIAVPLIAILGSITNYIIYKKYEHVKPKRRRKSIQVRTHRHRSR